MEQVSLLLSQVNAIFAEREQQVKQAEAAVENEVAALAREKELMAKVPATDSDIVYLNVGGSPFTTRRSTLKQATGSTLAAWFSGRWEDCLDHDDQGRTFLDFDPDLFQPILSFLRSCTIHSDPDTRPKLMGVDPIKQQAFTDLIKFLALEDYLGCARDTAMQSQLCTVAKADEGLSVSDDRQKVTCSANPQCYLLLVGPTCSRSCYFKVNINRLNADVFVGVMANDDISRNLAGTNFMGKGVQTPTSYGWILSKSGVSYRITKGSAFALPSLIHKNCWVLIQDDCWVLIKANFASQKLSMRTSISDKVFDIPLSVADDLIAKNAFVSGLVHHGDEVRLLPVTPEDQTLLE